MPTAIAAMRAGMTPDSMVDDSPITIGLFLTMSRTPSGASASTTALITAGGEATRKSIWPAIYPEILQLVREQGLTLSSSAYGSVFYIPTGFHGLHVLGGLDSVDAGEVVSGESQGVPLATMQKLAGYWANDYDWRKCEAKLNDLPHFITAIDGLDMPPPPARAD